MDEVMDIIIIMTRSWCTLIAYLRRRVTIIEIVKIIN